MARRITTIPATLNRYTAMPVISAAKRKVAGYARVSTDLEEQQTSYDAQMDYFRSYITGRSDWEFVGMYSDDGVTATSTRRREGFNRMIDDALAGKIDLIITKSISRFARNTVDSLITIRNLKEHGVEVFFEKENIWTLDSKGELLITIMSSLAQEESRSISENTTWGKRKAFADGKASVAYTHFLGYDKDFVINEEEAEIVRLIYRLFLSGLSFYAIAKELQRRGVKTTFGKDKWRVSTIRSILTNEKYKGCALLQKGYTVDFLTKKRKINEGEIPMYYIEEHHDAIISPTAFDLVQMQIEKRMLFGRRCVEPSGEQSGETSGETCGELSGEQSEDCGEQSGELPGEQSCGRSEHYERSGEQSGTRSGEQSAELSGGQASTLCGSQRANQRTNQHNTQYNKQYGRWFSGHSIYSSKIICGECGGYYGRKVWHSNDKYRKIVYRCNEKYHRKSGMGQVTTPHLTEEYNKGNTSPLITPQPTRRNTPQPNRCTTPHMSKQPIRCTTPHLTEEEIKQLFLKALNKMVAEKKQVIANLKTLRKMAKDTPLDVDTLKNELTALDKALRTLIAENARKAQNQDAYNREYEAKYAEYEQKKAELDEANREIRNRNALSAQITEFIGRLKNLEVQTEFDELLWCGIVDHVTVYAKDKIVFTFVGGIEVKV